MDLAALNTGKGASHSSSRFSIFRLPSLTVIVNDCKQIVSQSRLDLASIQKELASGEEKAADDDRAALLGKRGGDEVRFFRSPSLCIVNKFNYLINFIEFLRVIPFY